MAAIKVREGKYDEAKLNKLHMLIQHSKNMQQPIDYEILVDDYRIVPRTSEPEQFGKYADFVFPETETVTVILYKGNGSSGDKYFFYLKGGEKVRDNELAGMPEGMSVREWREVEKEKMRKELEQEGLEEEVALLKEQVEARDKTIVEMHKQIAEAKNEKNSFTALLGSFFTEGVLKNPKVEKVIKATPLAGIYDESEVPENQSQASFSRKGEEITDVENEDEKTGPQLSEEEQGYLVLIRDLATRLERQELSAVMHILDTLTRNKHAIGFTIKQLNNYLKQKPKENNENV